jgi:hypothetical protein
LCQKETNYPHFEKTSNIIPAYVVPLQDKKGFVMGAEACVLHSTQQLLDLRFLQFQLLFIAIYVLHFEQIFHLILFVATYGSCLILISNCPQLTPSIARYHKVGKKIALHYSVLMCSNRPAYGSLPL